MVHVHLRLAVALVTAAAAFSTQALDVTRNDFQGASGMCKAATPAYAASVRYRPLGLSNESESAVYVTCNWQGDDSQGSVRGARRVSVTVTNDGTADATFDCTLVNGFQSGTNLQATYTTKSTSVSAGAGATIEWLPAEVTSTEPTIGLPSLSCRLPGNTTLQFTRKEYNENVGA